MASSGPKPDRSTTTRLYPEETLSSAPWTFGASATPPPPPRRKPVLFGAVDFWSECHPPRRKPVLLHVRTRGDQHKKRRKKMARQWPRRP